MIKKSFRLMLLVAFALSSVMFVACNKYDDDIERIDNEIASLQATVQSLKAAVDGGAVISSVSNTAEGVKFTLSNGQSYVVNHGTAGADGAAGKDGSVVTIGENGNWFIDGVDTDMPAKGQGEPGKAPRINEAGNWEIWNAETETWDDTNVSAAGASTYVVESGAYYILNVMEKDAEGNNLGYKTINLNRTAEITSIEVVAGNGSIFKDDNWGTTVDINYGYTVAEDEVIEFNEKEWEEGTTLIAKGASLTAMINPLDAEASLYNFVLMDSKGAMPYVLGTPTKNMSEAPLTRADPTPNKGVWDMTVKFADGISFADDKVAAREAAAYALATATPDNQIASRYDVSINEQKVSSLTRADMFNGLNDAGKRVVDLTKCFVEPLKQNGENSYIFIRENGNVADYSKYIVDYYFEIADETQAAKYGAELNGDILTATKDGTVQIKVNYLLVDGTIAEGNRNTSADDDEKPNVGPAADLWVTFAYSVPSAESAEITWTVQKKNTNSQSTYRAFVELGELQNSLIGSYDYQLPSIAKVAYTWTDGKGLDTKNVTRNGNKYGKDGKTDKDSDGKYLYKFDGNESEWIAESIGWFYKKTNGTMAAVTGDTEIQTPLYAAFEFNYEEAMPGEYLVTLYLNKGGYNGSNYTTSLPVKVTIVDPELPILKLDNYFSGNNAVVYGEADYDEGNGNVTYDLLNLFETQSNMKFKETKVKGSDGNDRASWLSGSVISPNVYDYDANANGKLDRIYTTREYTASYTPWDNTHIEATKYVFNVTVKSPIYEGTLTSSASKTIDENEIEYFTVSDFAGKDVYGNSYVLGNVYAYDATNKVYNYNSTTADLDDRIVVVSVEGDDNAEKYLTYGTSFAKVDGLGADAFSVQRKPDQQLQSNVTCTLTVYVLDQWGMIKTQDVTVVLKKF